MKVNPKRIADLLMIFLLFGGCLAAQSNPDWGYPDYQNKALTLAANATGSFQITLNVDAFSLYSPQACSFTFNTATSTVYTASQTSLWEGMDGTRNIDIAPQAIGSGTYMWFKNGSTAQVIRFRAYGKR